MSYAVFMFIAGLLIVASFGYMHVKTVEEKALSAQQKSLEIAESAITKLSYLATDVRVLEERVAALEEADHQEREYVLSPFEKRIEQYKREMNLTTYPENEAPVYEKGVYNIPHSLVNDVSLQAEEEYAR